jgi:DNA-binding NtrC family response regulator
MAMMKDQLERLVDEMVTKGVRYEDAQREFEKRFIAHVLSASDGNLCKAADRLGMHRNTLSRKITEYRLRRLA